MTASPLYTPGVKTANSPLTGLERLFADNGSAQGEMVTAAQLAQLTTVAAQVYNTSALAASGTLAAANVTGGLDSVYLGMTGAFGGAANITLPTVASVLAANAQLAVGSTYMLRIINPSGYTLTLVAGTGWTLNGTASIPTETFRDYLVTIMSATAATIQDVGSGSAVAE
jgi:hypothetical protein